ncbi:hypothetical protein GWK47_023245 [Chionoecetes opilio]|uniref:Endonuclease/exonuclease/phosphatase domain-containing protein n=1 Tax=Chionoecetes opilio TaxID=41210 RepID=A0A8J5CJT1_CHIOP|nr:hypothetical protein GWK47_023245 [Chionoecetes opilio]
MGDLNARVGNPHIIGPDVKVYCDIKDETVNSHGRLLTKMCNSNDMVLVNNIKHNSKVLGGDLSFKKRNLWVSEIDLCVAKNDCVPYVKTIDVNQSMWGSDHAPLCVVLDTCGLNQMTPAILQERSGRLGEQYGYNKPTGHQALPRSCKYSAVNLEEFTSIMENMTPPDVSVVTPQEVNNVISTGFETVNRVARRCFKRRVRRSAEVDDTLPRWQRLLETNDAKQIWAAVNWKGNIDTSENFRPDDEQFRQHFEELLNPGHSHDVVASVDLDSAPTIPVLDDPFAYSPRVAHFGSWLPSTHGCSSETNHRIFLKITSL